jgi:hypothetical protein
LTTADGTVIGAVQIVNHGPATKRWNLVLLSEGYRKSELSKFASDAQDFVDALFSTPPFDNLKIRCSINVFRIDVGSNDSGADDPATSDCAGSGAKVDTYFDATFCGNNKLRRLLVVNTPTGYYHNYTWFRFCITNW